jgi:hypothetical protein
MPVRVMMNCVVVYIGSRVEVAWWASWAASQVGLAVPEAGGDRLVGLVGMIGRIVV